MRAAAVDCSDNDRCLGLWWCRRRSHIYTAVGAAAPNHIRVVIVVIAILLGSSAVLGDARTTTTSASTATNDTGSEITACAATASSTAPVSAARR